MVVIVDREERRVRAECAAIYVQHQAKCAAVEGDCAVEIRDAQVDVSDARPAVEVLRQWVSLKSVGLVTTRGV